MSPLHQRCSLREALSISYLTPVFALGLVELMPKYSLEPI
jgi:hypothetical protein